MSNEKKYQVKLTKQGEPSKFWNTVEPLDGKGYPFISQPYKDGQDYLYYIYKGLIGVAEPGEWRELQEDSRISEQDLKDIRWLIEYAELNLNQVLFAHEDPAFKPVLDALRRSKNKFEVKS